MEMHMNAVRLIVKTGMGTEFVKRFEGMDHKGLSQSYSMKTGESNFAAVGALIASKT